MTNKGTNRLMNRRTEHHTPRSRFPLGCSHGAVPDSRCSCGSGNRSHAAHTTLFVRLITPRRKHHLRAQRQPQTCTTLRCPPDMPHHRPHDRPPAAATTLVSRHTTLVSLCVDAELFNRNPPRPEWRTASRSRPGPSALSTERWRQNRILHGYQDRLDSISPSVQKSTMRTFREAPSPHGVQL